MLMSLNKGAAAMLVSLTNPPGIGLYSYGNAFFCFGWKTCSLITWVKTLYTFFRRSFERYSVNYSLFFVYRLPETWQIHLPPPTSYSQGIRKVIPTDVELQFNEWPHYGQNMKNQRAKSRVSTHWDLIKKIKDTTSKWSCLYWFGKIVLHRPTNMAA